MSEQCPHAQEIGAMQTTLKKHEIAIGGNGKDGLILKVDRLEQTAELMKESLDTIARSTSAFAKSQIEQDAIERDKVKVSERKARAFQIVGVVTAAVVGVVGLVYVILNYAASVN